MHTTHRFPARPLAGGGIETSRRAADYRAAVERLLAAGVTGSEAIAAALNASAVYTPPGTAWDGGAVERLLRFLRLRPPGRRSSIAQAEPSPAALLRARAGGF